jgi:predicted ribosomally synthesized peptide with nif11-like leader
MPLHDLEALVAKMKADSAFLAELMATENMAECMELVFAKGFSCTTAEVRQGFAEILKNASEKISEVHYSLWGNIIPDKNSK